MVWFGLAAVEQAPVYAALGILYGVTPALGRVVTLEANDVPVAAELGGIIHADALYGDGELAHLLEVDGVAHLHAEFHRVEELPQHEPHVGGLRRAALFNHLLNVL